MLMSTPATTPTVREPSDVFPEDELDWAELKPSPAEELAAAELADPDAPPLELLIARGWRRLVNPRRLREQLGLTQEEFGEMYGIPVGTLRDWEQRRKMPDATARAYRMVIERDPKAVAALFKPAA